MLMRGHNLIGHLDGSRPDFARTMAQNNQDVKNPAFFSWYRKDQLIQNAIFASIQLLLLQLLLHPLFRLLGMLCTLRMPINWKQESLVCAIISLVLQNKPFLSLIIYTMFDLSVMNFPLVELLCPMRNWLSKSALDLDLNSVKYQLLSVQEILLISYPELYEKLLFSLSMKKQRSHSQHPLMLLLHSKQACILTPETPIIVVQMQIPPTPTSQVLSNHGVLATITNNSFMITLWSTSCVTVLVILLRFADHNHTINYKPGQTMLLDLQFNRIIQAPLIIWPLMRKNSLMCPPTMVQRR